MPLPPFRDLLTYAKGEGGGPQRFLYAPDQEALADWELSVGGTVLPVHSQILCNASKVYLGMETEGLSPEGPLALPNGPALPMALAFLRIIYSNEAHRADTIGFMAENNLINGVLRLLDALDCPSVMVAFVEGTLSAVTANKYRYIAPEVLRQVPTFDLGPAAPASLDACAQMFEAAAAARATTPLWKAHQLLLEYIGGATADYKYYISRQRLREMAYMDKVTYVQIVSV